MIGHNQPTIEIASLTSSTLLIILSPPIATKDSMPHSLVSKFRVQSTYELHAKLLLRSPKFQMNLSARRRVTETSAVKLFDRRAGERQQQSPRERASAA